MEELELNAATEFMNTQPWHGVHIMPIQSAPSSLKKNPIGTE
jgi:hypothetical protein